jgi:hypothetical protein
MQIKTVWKILRGVIIFWIVVTSSVNAMSPKRTLVDVRCNGDDGLTQRICATLENEFKASQDFMLSTENEPEMLVVTIPTNVDWEKVHNRIRVIYTVEFTSALDQRLGESKGRCWNDSLATCTSQILKNARVAARRVAHNSPRFLPFTTPLVPHSFPEYGAGFGLRGKVS